MSALARRKHEKSDKVTVRDDGALECTCGWFYASNSEFRDAVIARHTHESTLL